MSAVRSDAWTDEELAIVAEHWPVVDDIYRALRRRGGRYRSRGTVRIKRDKETKRRRGGLLWDLPSEGEKVSPPNSE